jgi:hypothetical protein
MLELIRAHYWVGVDRAFQHISNLGDVSGSAKESLDALITEQPISWVDVLNLAEAEGEKRWAEHFERLAMSYLSSRRASETIANPALIETSNNPKRRKSR